MQIDHIFIRSKRGAPEAEVFKAFGLTEASPNTHSGQGTANRRFFFKNFFLELLFLENEKEALSLTTQPTQLFERLSENQPDISPFGICFRPSDPLNPKPKFPSWRYQPSYLPSSLHIDIARNLSLAEPMWFFLSLATRPDLAPIDRQQPLKHFNDLSELTSITLHIPKLSKSLTINEVQQIENLELINAENHLLELIFDHQKQGKKHDFRPDLNLIFLY